MARKSKGGNRRLQKGPSPADVLRKVDTLPPDTNDLILHPQDSNLPVPSTAPPSGRPGDNAPDSSFKKLPPPPPGGKPNSGKKTQSSQPKSGRTPDPKQVQQISDYLGINPNVIRKETREDGEWYVAPIPKGSARFRSVADQLIRNQLAKHPGYVVLSESAWERDPDGAVRIKYADGNGNTISERIQGEEKVRYTDEVGPVTVEGPQTPIASPESEFRTGTYYFNKGPLFMGRKVRTNRLDNP